MSDRVDCTKATATKPHLRWPRFISNRCKELAYGGLFSTVFLLSQSPLHALVIDDIRVLSKLGEPFLAEIRVAPAAGELINDRCFTALRGSGDLPRISNVKLRLTRQLNTQVLQVIGDRPVREPMSQLVLQVKCPGVPTIVRDFMVLVDPPA
ncbi:MAG: hypothetical protein HKN49_04545, partial [Gammaproteobacteria bacterium]|nr:hypothetical protein [Gammaproteobacteria bacterium]